MPLVRRYVIRWPLPTFFENELTHNSIFVDYQSGRRWSLPDSDFSLRPDRASIVQGISIDCVAVVKDQQETICCPEGADILLLLRKLLPGYQSYHDTGIVRITWNTGRVLCSNVRRSTCTTCKLEFEIVTLSVCLDSTKESYEKDPEDIPLWHHATATWSLQVPVDIIVMNDWRYSYAIHIYRYIYAGIGLPWYW